MQARSDATKATLAVITSVGKYGVVLQTPVGASGDTPRSFGKSLVDAFMALIKKTDQLDGKDAMHIVTAKLLGCGAFVSNDGDFRFVADEVVFCANPRAVVV